MKILAIESSCDETSAAVVEDGPSASSGLRVLSDVVASSEKMHIETGGIVPEVAAREQVKSIISVIDKAIGESKVQQQEIDAIAVTVGPGLIGSLLVGVETAKTLALAWKKPIIPVNHLTAHLYANWIKENDKIQDTRYKQIPSSKSQIQNVPQFPAIGLVVSGGHTDLVLMKSHTEMKLLGGTRDDAAGEAFDKAARILGLPYPGGPAIAVEAAKSTNFKKQDINKFQVLNYKLPRPMINSNDFDFSFSGLKTAVLNEVQKVRDVRKVRSEMAWEIQEAITDVLVSKLVKAVGQYDPKAVLLAGGVAANQRLKEKLEEKIKEINLFVPKPRWCTDNAAYIGSWALLHSRFRKGKLLSSLSNEINNIKADPSLEIV